MENKINLVELLKDCPKGMELDCTCADNVVFDKIIEYGQIKCVIGECRDPLILDKYGRLLHICCPKCVIFPKGKDTWEGFQRPFKDGDVVATNDGDWVGITTGGKSEVFIPTYCVFKPDGTFKAYLDKKETWQFDKLATEEERKKLFKAIKDNGYRWDEETKTLEKLIEPKFDITTLKPFDKVLTRANDEDSWVCNLYSHRIKDYYVILNAELALQCIPYENNKHLLGTTNDCDEFYKTWE